MALPQAPKSCRCKSYSPQQHAKIVVNQTGHRPGIASRGANSTLSPTPLVALPGDEGNFPWLWMRRGRGKGFNGKGAASLAPFHLNNIPPSPLSPEVRSMGQNAERTRFVKRRIRQWARDEDEAGMLVETGSR